MRLVFPLVLFSVVCAGCSSSHALRTDSESARADLNRRAANGLSQLTLADGRVLQARSLHVGPERAVWTDPASAAPHSVPTEEVVAVCHTRRMRGGVEGLLIGTAVGVAVGGVIGYAAGEDEPGSVFDAEDGSIFSRSEMALILGSGLGVVGGGAGLAAGFSQGHRADYVRLAPDMSEPSGPAATRDTVSLVYRSRR